MFVGRREPPVSDCGVFLLPTSVRKVWRTKTRSVVESCCEGWRERAPTRSRRAMPRMIWCGVCWEVRNKKPLMAIHVLMMVVTYCRPGEFLQSMREDLVRPMHGVASDWSQRGVPSKTQSYDDTIDLRNQICPWITKVAAVDGRTMFRTSAAILGRLWTKRDNTAPDNSIVRYEESARLAQIQSDLNKKSTNHILSSRGAYLWETPRRGRSATLSDGGRLFLHLFSMIVWPEARSASRFLEPEIW